jgi:hypothetical protein
MIAAHRKVLKIIEVVEKKGISMSGASLSERIICMPYGIQQLQQQIEEMRNMVCCDFITLRN